MMDNLIRLIKNEPIKNELNKNELNKNEPNKISELVDEMGLLKAKIKIIELREQIIRKELLQTNEKYFVGKKYAIIIESSNRKVFNSQKARAHYGTEWYDSYCHEITIDSLRITRRE